MYFQYVAHAWSVCHRPLKSSMAPRGVPSASKIIYGTKRCAIGLLNHLWHQEMMAPRDDYAIMYPFKKDCSVITACTSKEAVLQAFFLWRSSAKFAISKCFHDTNFIIVSSLRRDIALQKPVRALHFGNSTICPGQVAICNPGLNIDITHTCPQKGSHS